MRLQKFLRIQGLGSIRKCDEIIQTQTVYINGVLLSAPTTYLNEGDIINVMGNQFTFVTKKEDHTYLLFNKPSHILCSHKQEQGKKTIFDCLESTPYYKKKLYYGGRLDYLSRGLMILSSDGDFINKITHPSARKLKTYMVKTKKNIHFPSLNKIAQGLGDYHPFKFTQLNPCYVKIELYEGKKRQIRLIFESINNQVIDLCRTQIGQFELKNLKEGELKTIDEPFGSIEKKN